MWTFAKTIEGETILVNLDTGEILTKTNLAEDETAGTVIIKKIKEVKV